MTLTRTILWVSTSILGVTSLQAQSFDFSSTEKADTKTASEFIQEIEMNKEQAKMKKEKVRDQDLNALRKLLRSARSKPLNSSLENKPISVVNKKPVEFKLEPVRKNFKLNKDKKLPSLLPDLDLVQQKEGTNTNSAKINTDEEVQVFELVEQITPNRYLLSPGEQQPLSTFRDGDVMPYYRTKGPIIMGATY